MENSEKNPIEEKEQNLSELGNEQMEQAAGGGVNLGAILDIAADGIDAFFGNICDKHEPGELLSTRYKYTGEARGAYQRTRTYICRKCGREFIKNDHVTNPTL